MYASMAISKTTLKTGLKTNDRRLLEAQTHRAGSVWAGWGVPPTFVIHCNAANIHPGGTTPPANRAAAAA